MSVRFEDGKVILKGYKIQDPIDDLMFFLMPFGINEQQNVHYCCGEVCTNYKSIDETHMHYKGTLSRTQRIAIVQALKKYTM